MDACGRCGEEIRFGARGSDPRWPGPRWLHRGEADHEPIHGAPTTPEKWDQIMGNLARQVADKNSKKRAKDRGLEDPEPEEEKPDILPEPEIPMRDAIPEDFQPRSGIRQMLNLLGKHGWEVRRLTTGRGPWMSATGKMLSVSDVWVLGALGPETPGQKRRRLVAWWRDGGFEACLLIEGNRLVERSNSTRSKPWIRGEPLDSAG